MVHHRVLVQLKDSQLNNSGSKYPVCYNVEFPCVDSAPDIKLADSKTKSANKILSADLEVLDKRTLLMCKKTSTNLLSASNNYARMEFDSVGYVSDAYIRNEISGLMNQLVLHHRNCGLIRFEVNRECNLRFLCNLIVTEVENRMNLYNNQTQSIKLEFYDVRKYDLINATENSKHRVNDSKRTIRISTIKNTVDLHKWLYLEYVPIWNTTQGHEWLDLEFVYLDSGHLSYKTKLSLLTLYMSNMDSDTRRNLTNYFNTIGSKQKIPRTMVIDCIKEFFSGEEQWSTLVIFDMPKKSFYQNVVDEMLTIAKAAYVGIKSLHTAKTMIPK